LYYYGARYYDPEIGRFISADTFNLDFTNPQGLNRYTYCFNNPLRHTDPSGNWPPWDQIKSAANTVVNKVKDGLQVAQTKVAEVTQSVETKVAEGKQVVKQTINEVKQTALDTIGITKVENVVDKNLQTDPISAIYVSEQGPIGSAMDSIGIAGVSINPIGVLIRPEIMSSNSLRENIKHECLHYSEQSYFGMIPWLAGYYGEIGVKYIYYWDYWSGAYADSSFEKRALDYAGQPRNSVVDSWFERTGLQDTIWDWWLGQ
jgi:hypothetical protein